MVHFQTAQLMYRTANNLLQNNIQKLYFNGGGGQSEVGFSFSGVHTHTRTHTLIHTHIHTCMQPRGQSNTYRDLKDQLS